MIRPPAWNLAIALHAGPAPGICSASGCSSWGGPVGCLIAAVARLNGAASVAISDMGRSAVRGGEARRGRGVQGRRSALADRQWL
ncbi:MAG: hypothetical protein ACLR7Z_10130 [Bilophila wadsworthia]